MTDRPYGVARPRITHGLPYCATAACPQERAHGWQEHRRMCALTLRDTDGSRLCEPAVSALLNMMPEKP